MKEGGLQIKSLPWASRAESSQGTLNTCRRYVCQSHSDHKDVFTPSPSGQPWGGRGVSSPALQLGWKGRQSPSLAMQEGRGTWGQR